MSKLAEMESPADSHPSESGCGRWFQESPHPPQTPKSADAPVLKCLTEKVSTRDLPGGPVVRTPHSQYRGAGLRSRTLCSAVKKANNERAVQSPSSCWVCACSQRHTLWVSQGAEPLGLSRMSLLHPNPHLRDRFGDSRLHRLQTPVCARPPPSRVHSLPRGPSGSPRPPCWLRSSTRTISFRKALGAVSRMLCTVLRRVAQASSWKQRTTLAVGRLSAGGGCCRHLRGGEAGREEKGSPSRGGSSQWLSSQLVGSLPGLSQNLH